MTYPTRVGLALTVALLLPLATWVGLTRDTAALAAAGALAAGVVLVGVLARALRLGDLGAVVGQTLVLATAFVVGSGLASGTGGLARIGDLVTEGIRHIQDGVVPLDAHPGVALLIGVGVGLLALLADLLAVTLRWPTGAALPLLGLFAVPALGSESLVGFAPVGAFAAGLALVLLAAAEPARPRAAAWLTAAAVTAASLGVAWAVGPRLPIEQTPLGGSDTIQMSDPSLDLKRNLTQPDDVLLLTYLTDLPTGSSLRLATLPAFSGSGFGLAEMRVVTGRVPRPPGFDADGVPRTTSVQVVAFESEWLPVPYAPTRVRAPGRWGYAVETLDVLALAGPGRSAATRELAYSVESIDIRPSAEQVATAGTSEVPGWPELTELPVGTPPRLAALADELTADTPTAGAAALALEAYLRSDRFTYDTARAADGDSLGTLNDFLFGSRTGYCEQYAAAMAALARAAGIPSRVAVGFTPGTLQGGVWEVSAHDMHAWPELWLDGWGWVAFEPTPEGATSARVTPSPATTPTPTAPQPSSAAPSAQASAEAPPPAEVPTAEEPAVAEPGPDAGVQVPWSALTWLVLLGGALVAPRLVRDRRRRARLAGSPDARADALAAWDELRDTVSDLGLAWPAGSPRYAGEALATRVGEPAADGVRRLARATERALFDRAEAFEGREAWGDVLAAVTQALRGLVSRRTAFVSRWWPRSLFGRR